MEIKLGINDPFDEVECKKRDSLVRKIYREFPNALWNRSDDGYNVLI